MSGEVTRPRISWISFLVGVPIGLAAGHYLNPWLFDRVPGRVYTYARDDCEPGAVGHRVTDADGVTRIAVHSPGVTDCPECKINPVRRREWW